MAKKAANGNYTTDRLLNLAQKCEQGCCNSKCLFYGKEDCKTKLVRKLRQRLWSYYSVVGELERSDG